MAKPVYIVKLSHHLAGPSSYFFFLAQTAFINSKVNNFNGGVKYMAGIICVFPHKYRSLFCKRYQTVIHDY